MRVVLAEDSLLLREGLVRLLDEAGASVVAAVGDGTALVEAVHEHRPDVAVVDVRMPPTHTDEGLRAAVEARRAVPGTAVLVLSQYVEVAYADELLADGAGGVGYLLKDRVADVDTFLAALEDVVAGGTVLDPQVVAQLQRRPQALVGVRGRHPDVDHGHVRLVLGHRGQQRVTVGDGRAHLVPVVLDQAGQALPQDHRVLRDHHSHHGSTLAASGVSFTPSSAVQR